jgi:hypothetical protein
MLASDGGYTFAVEVRNFCQKGRSWSGSEAAAVKGQTSRHWLWRTLSCGFWRRAVLSHDGSIMWRRTAEGRMFEELWTSGRKVYLQVSLYQTDARLPVGRNPSVCIVLQWEMMVDDSWIICGAMFMNFFVIKLLGNVNSHFHLSVWKWSSLPQNWHLLTNKIA